MYLANAFSNIRRRQKLRRQERACSRTRAPMDKSLDELAAEGNRGKRRREDDGRQQGWQGGGDRRRGGGGGWQGGGGGGWQGGGGGGGWQRERRDGVRVRRGAEGAHRPAPASAREAYCFFGDSFVRLFGLVRHPDVSVHAFKGATCRGLGKEGNENRVEITRRLAAKPEAKVAIFTFGNVDVHFSYYYSLHGKAAPQRH